MEALTKDEQIIILNALESYNDSLGHAARVLNPANEIIDQQSQVNDLWTKLYKTITQADDSKQCSQCGVIFKPDPVEYSDNELPF